MQDVKLATTALYYPYIHFRYLDWLKSALLYWDKVQRIVPSKNFPLNDPPEIRDLIDKGLIENVAAQKYVKEAADAFTPRLEQLLQKRNYQLIGSAQKTAERALNVEDRHFHLAALTIC
jgi:hypothetical protein